VRVGKVVNAWIWDVLSFHEKFEIRSAKDTPHWPTTAEMDRRWRLLDEELKEMRLAYAQRDLVEFTDAILDVIYVLIGTAIKMSIDLTPLWSMVHSTNMAKEKSPIPGHKAVKPPGWVGPDIAGGLREQGWTEGQE
jgi:predicted HAD superfamily Cof-like phosphohydrolase